MKIIYEVDGNVCVLSPILGNGLTLKQIIAKDVPKGILFHIVDDSAIPNSREHRYAWRLNGKKIEIDQLKVDQRIAELKQRESRRAAILSKINISEKELMEIL